MVEALRYALRKIRTAPASALVAALIIGIGVGANAAVFGVIRAVLLKPLPYADADRLVRISETWPTLAGPRPVSTLNYRDWAAQNTVFERMAAVSWGSVTVGDGRQPTYVYGSRVSPAYFDVFGLHA